MAQLYIANLGKYVEGELVGAWIQLPFEEDEFKEFLEEKVGINEEYEEYAIHDTDNMPFEVGEYDNVMEVNEQYKEYEEATNYYNEDIVDTIIGYYAFDEGMQIVNNEEFIYWNDCFDMKDVAYEIVEEYGIDKDDMLTYFDYDKFIRDLEYDDFFNEYMEDYDGEMTYDDKEAIAMEMVECGIGEETLKAYFDYEMYGNDIEINGTFIYGDDGIVEILY